MKKKFIIIGTKPWAKRVYKRLKKKNFFFLDKENQFSKRYINKINPNKIFILHWHKIIPKEIYKNYDCIIFHMTDVPYGRGGSPLQNLIIRKFKYSMLSAIKCTEKIDAGPVYMKKKYSLKGNASKIFFRIEKLTAMMIQEIINKKIKPKSQKGKVYLFKRINYNQNNLSNAKTLIEIFDMIRMVDGENYLPAFVKMGKFRLNFSDAKIKKKKLYAKVTFLKND